MPRSNTSAVPCALLTVSLLSSPLPLCGQEIEIGPPDIEARWAVGANTGTGLMVIERGTLQDQITGSMLTNSTFTGLYIPRQRQLAVARRRGNGSPDQFYQATMTRQGTLFLGSFFTWVTSGRVRREQIEFPFIGARLGVRGTFRVIGVPPGESLPIMADPDRTSELRGSIPAHGHGIVVTGDAQVVFSGEDARVTSMEHWEAWSPVTFGTVEGWTLTAHLSLQHGTADDALGRRALEVLRLLRDADFAGLARVIHPERGFFLARDRWARSLGGEYTASEVEAWTDDTVLRLHEGEDVWDEPTIAEARDRWLYGDDFLDARATSFGTSFRLNDFDPFEAEPGTEFVEFLVTPMYHWTSGQGYSYRGELLRLVFERIDGEPYLIAAGVETGLLR